jgi:hypothetical protein
MIPRDSDRKPAPRASQNGQCGTHDPEETGYYPPAASWPPAATVSGGPSSGATNESTSSARLKPPESSAGSPTTAFSDSWARAAWGLSSWPKTVFFPGPSP